MSAASTARQDCAGFVLVADDAIVEAHGANVPVPWWSFTKAVLAAATLSLVREGRLALDASLAGRPFTLRQLLQHRAGLAEYGGLKEYQEAVARGDEAWPAELLLEKTDASRLRYSPDQGWTYSNIGYLFIRRAIEEATGSELGVALHRLVLDPLGIAEVALLMDRSGERIVGIREGYDPGWVYHGLLVGPLRSAVLLLHRLLRGSLLPPALVTRMLEGHPVGGPMADRPWAQPGYGLGLMCGMSRFGRIAGHTGGGPDSVLAIYSARDANRTAGAFALGDDSGTVETAAMSAACS